MRFLVRLEPVLHRSLHLVVVYLDLLGDDGFSRRWPMMASLRMMTGVMYLLASSKAFIVKSKDSCTEEGQIAMTS